MPRPLAVWAAVAVMGAALLSGCSTEQTSLGHLPAQTSASTPSAGTATSTASPSPTGTGTASSRPALEGADLVKVAVAPPPNAEEAGVFEDYVQFWQADMAALARSDPAWPPLLQRVTGQQRTDTVNLLTANRDQGHKVTGTITLKPQVVVVRGPVATVRDCVDLSKTHVVDSSEATVPGSQGKAGLQYAVTMTKQAGTWTVSNIDRVDGPACA